MVEKKIERIIQKFVAVLLNKGIRIEQVILYGSYASGNINPYSDIDIAIISPDFGNDSFMYCRLGIVASAGSQSSRSGQ